MIYAFKRLIAVKWRQLTRCDLKGDLQMDLRAARQDVMDAWYEFWHRNEAK